MPLIAIVLFIWGLMPVHDTPPVQACTSPIIFPIISDTELDVDQDGVMDRVILYEKQKDVWMAIEDGTSCTIVTEHQLTNFIDGIDYGDDFEIEEIHPVQLVELTGDDHPELYVGLLLRGGGRHTANKHFIYTMGNNGWEELAHPFMCARSNFEFRQGDDPTRMDVYVDEDIPCDEIASSVRPYYMLRWNGEWFAYIEEGKVTVDTTAENMGVYVLLFACCGLPALITLFIFLAVARRLPFVRYGETPVGEKPVE